MSQWLLLGTLTAGAVSAYLSGLWWDERRGVGVAMGVVAGLSVAAFVYVYLRLL